MLPASIAHHAASVKEIEQTLARSRGFVLLPIEVRGPDIARAFASYLNQTGRLCEVIDTDNPQAWEELPATIVAAAERAGDATSSAVLLIEPPTLSPAVLSGLRLLNQRRDTIVKTLNRPLLWCGSANFLNTTWEQAPDFWSIRAVDTRFIQDEHHNPESKESNVPLESRAIGALAKPDREKIEKLERLRHDALETGDLLTSTRTALRLVDEWLRLGLADQAARVLEEVDAGEPASKTGPIADEVALRRADVDAQRGHFLTAAATLGALLARQNLPVNLRGNAALRMGRLLEENGDLERAEHAYQEAIDAARANRNQELLARALVGAFGIAARTGRAALAEKPLREAESIARRIGDDVLTAAALAALSAISIDAEDRSQAAKQIDSAKRLRDESNKKTSLAVDSSAADILILTALQDELEGVLSLDHGWQEARDLSGFRYYRGSTTNAQGTSLSIAAAWIGEMGQRSAAIRGQQLVNELSPSCLAMCGICAGYRKEVSLGDIIVASKIYAYDEGKREVSPEGESKFLPSIYQFKLEHAWQMDVAFLARDIDLAPLQEQRPPSKHAQRRWILHTLHTHESENGPAPMQHPDRRRACPQWTEQLRELLKDGLVAMQGRTLALTDAGRNVVLEDQLLYPDGLPPEPALRVHVGAIATGSAVVKDADIFERLRQIDRHTLGIEMEGAGIAEVAERAGIKSILVKAVSDFADHDKDDSFRPFACRASASFLLAFLEKHFQPAPTKTRDEHHELRPDDFGREHAFLRQVERAASIKYAGGRITPHDAPHPFSGVLEVHLQKGPYADTHLIAALDQPITPELLTTFARNIERPYRYRNPLLRSTLVHQGDSAPRELHVEAQRNGIRLETFREYQGLFDLTRYLEWQTRRLETDQIYLPGMYVDAPASFEVSGNRARHEVDNALRLLWDLLAAHDRRFALVLGEFGAGKTFLLHELARRMVVEKHPVWPVLVKMDQLEKKHDLAQLLASHFMGAQVYDFNFPGFQYMLEEGRIALLFDGYDELADRVTYDSATAHFGMVLSAAQGGSAKVILSSRRQHFLSDTHVKLELARRAENLPGFHLVLLRPFEETQIRQYLRHVLMSERAADERYTLINDVQDLLGLSHNPRMLGFIARIPEAKLREAKRREGTITAAGLYELLLQEWLDFEHRRSQNRTTLKDGISREALEKGMTVLAMSMWHAKQKAVSVEQLREVLAQVMVQQDQSAMDPHMITHMFGSGSLLVRDEGGQFSFVHRSVLEWLVAREAARELVEHGDSAALGADEMSLLMADFFRWSVPDREAVITWARGKLDAQDKGIAAKNATTVLQRMGESLQRVDFSGQDLRGRDFSGVDWRGANLQNADLRGATLVGANLEGTNLTGANLSRADLTGAKLSGARLDQADLRFTKLIRADLSQCSGMETASLFATNMAWTTGISEVLAAAVMKMGGVPPKVGWATRMVALPSECYSVAFDPTGELLAAGYSDGTVRIFDAVTGDVLRVSEGHRQLVATVTWSPDGRTIASGSLDQGIRLRDAASGRELRVMQADMGVITCVAWSPDGQMLASASYANSIRLWDVASGREMILLQGHKHRVTSVAWSPDGRTIASGSGDTTIRLWDVGSGRELRALQGHKGWVTSVGWSPDGSRLVSGSKDDTISVWDISTGRQVRRWQLHMNEATSVAWCPNGRFFASGTTGGSVHVWATHTQSELRVMQGHKNSVTSISWHPDGTTTASASRDGTIRLWDVSTGRELRVLQAPTKPEPFHTIGLCRVDEEDALADDPTAT